MIKFGPSGNSDSFYKEGYDHIATKHKMCV